MRPNQRDEAANRRKRNGRRSLTSTEANGTKPPVPLPSKALETPDEDPHWRAWLAYVAAVRDRLENGEPSNEEIGRWLDDGGR